MSRRRIVGIALAVVVLVSAFGFLLVRQARLEGELSSMRSDLRDLDWHVSLAAVAESRDLITLEVGVIQFLKGGYSISLDSVSHDQNGVRLVGLVGNPHLLNLATLTLNFRVTEPLATVRDELHPRNPFRPLVPASVGNAQVAVGSVAAGSQARFRVTIPNVKQRVEPYEVEVSFSSERYSYIR